MGEGVVVFMDENGLGEIKEEPFVTIEGLVIAVEKQKAKEIIDDGAFGCCPNCKEEFNSELINEYSISYCHNCGQKLIRDIGVEGK